jgi:hypothetical protein
MRVITAHVQLLDEALDLVRNDSSGVVLSFTHYNGTPLALLLHLMLQNSLFSSSSSQAGIFFTMTKQALGNSKYLQFVLLPSSCPTLFPSSPPSRYGTVRRVTHPSTAFECVPLCEPLPKRCWLS